MRGKTAECNTSTLTWTRIKKEVIKIGRHSGEVIEILTFPRNRQKPGTSVSIWGNEADEYHILKPGEENCPFIGLWFEIITWVRRRRPLDVAFLFFFFLFLSAYFWWRAADCHLQPWLCVFPAAVSLFLHTESRSAGNHRSTSQIDFHYSLRPHEQAAVSGTFRTWRCLQHSPLQGPPLCSLKTQYKLFWKFLEITNRWHFMCM